MKYVYRSRLFNVRNLGNHRSAWFVARNEQHALYVASEDGLIQEPERGETWDITDAVLTDDWHRGSDMVVCLNSGQYGRIVPDWNECYRNGGGFRLNGNPMFDTRPPLK